VERRSTRLGYEPPNDVVRRPESVALAWSGVGNLKEARSVDESLLRSAPNTDFVTAPGNACCGISCNQVLTLMKRQLILMKFLS
jgi:hypothetical protein